jgi:multicomponent K+:H+ antiporter subunit G
MIHSAPDVPAWAAWLISLFVLLGSVLTLIGSLGLARLRSFYDRAHAPTMGSSAGVGFITIASVIASSVLHDRLALHEVLIFFFVTITMPVTLMLLARAALFRDRVDGKSPVPARYEIRLMGEAGPAEPAGVVNSE